jgi:replicative DNA helicase
MNIDIIILKLLLDSTYFNKYHKVINLEFYKNNNRDLFKIFRALFEFHKTQPVEPTLADFILFFYTEYPLLKPEEKLITDTVFSQVESLEIDQELALDYLNKHNEQTVATSVAIKALEVSQGKAPMTDLKALLEGYQDVQEESQEDLFVSDDLELLVNNEILSNGLRWRLDTMNKTVGSLRKGNFGFLFARPETGKTTFLASEVTHMAEQAKELGLGPVLWFNNEEVGSTVKLRCVQAVFGITTQTLYTELPHYNDQYAERIGSYIKIYDRADITKSAVEQLCKELNPSLIIFDQIDKVRWQDNERYDLKMKAIYQWARELAKMYCPVIGVCQAGGTAEGKKYLNMNDVDSSHTAKQGEADFMIGIGKTNTDGEEFMRFISMCKNKLGKDADCIADLRHAKLPVAILPDIARYQDSMTFS